ncbi:hypothetical protein [Thiocapsa bogorovii]|uniref:hypothetical protein n=1 Tax=Thiocapsa bogorovii TaxID=521689 RepID=UPI001E63E981|nr:hypothetical protein [Thiocapsa bogorovii]UHD15726.1 hypothetical protein LT988_21095 [Thiocapsa bogorovii]
MTPTLTSTRDYLAAQISDNGSIELRHQIGERWTTGWFDDLDRLVRQVDRLRDRGNLFTSLNGPKPRHVGNGMTGSPICNGDVAWVTRIPFDFDPCRPTGVSSTADELKAALGRRDALVAMLRKLDWPIPLHGLSGNGYHAVYRVRLPSNDETTEMFRSIYSGLAAEFADDEVDFDRSVKNPGRIFRLYGTRNRKGPDTPERPHRDSACWIPAPWRQVERRLVEDLANFYARRSTPAVTSSEPRQAGPRIGGKGDYTTLDVVAWLTAHGLYRHAVDSTTHSVWCPWRDGHSTPHGRTGAVVFVNPGRWPGFHCHHGSCAGRTIADVVASLGDADAYCTAAFQGGRSHV